MEKYFYNKQTLQYEKVEITPKQRLSKVFGYFAAVGLASIVLFTFAYFFLPSPKEKALTREMDQMAYHYNNLQGDVENLNEAVEDMHKKDSELHRVVFGLSPIDDGIWEGGVGGHNPAQLTSFKRTGQTLQDALDKVTKLKRKIQLQQLSFDTLFTLALDREEKFKAIPSIKPVQSDKLKRKIRYMSGFGYRIHPVHKVKKFHAGIDFSAPKGTPIQATGDGKIIKVEKRRTGYGYNVTIKHGYGYETLYAHMKTIDVKKGQKVTKGQKIGTVGSTGTSTAPHLHYEVRLNGKAVNPIDYCMDGLTPEEYQLLVNLSAEENQSFD